jgi:hypothetical protein
MLSKYNTPMLTNLNNITMEYHLAMLHKTGKLVHNYTHAHMMYFDRRFLFQKQFKQKGKMKTVITSPPYMLRIYN